MRGRDARANAELRPPKSNDGKKELFLDLR